MSEDHCPCAPRTYVVVDLGWPVRGRQGYRALGTLTAPNRGAARALLDVLRFARQSRGPVALMAPRAAGPALLIDALTADAQTTA